MLDEQAFVALNALYLKKMAAAGQLPEITGLAADEVHGMVTGFAARGWVLDMDGELLIQPEGMTQVEDYYRETYAGLGEQEVMLRWYRRFETINEQFIKVVSDWQQTEGDPRVQERVIGTVQRLVKLIRQLTAVIPRYAAYVSRFERGVTTVDQGNLDFVCTPTVDSLHNIWFEFHEDLLAVLGRPRET